MGFRAAWSFRGALRVRAKLTRVEGFELTAPSRGILEPSELADFDLRALHAGPLDPDAFTSFSGSAGLPWHMESMDIRSSALILPK